MTVASGLVAGGADTVRRNRKPGGERERRRKAEEDSSGTGVSDREMWPSRPGRKLRSLEHMISTWVLWAGKGKREDCVFWKRKVGLDWERLDPKRQLEERTDPQHLTFP